MDIYCDFGGDCCNARGFRTENAAEAESFWSAGQSSVCVCVNIRSYKFMSLNFMAALTSISKLPHFSNIYFFRVLCRESTNLIAQKFGPKTKNAEMSKFLVCGFFD